MADRTGLANVGPAARLRARSHLLLVVALALLLFLPTFGAAFRWLPWRFFGLEAVDHYGTQWFYWFVGLQLQTGGTLLHTDLLFFPYGKDILLHTGANVLDAVAALPFRVAFGPVAGYNLFLLAALAFNAWAFQRLARSLTRDPVAQWGSSLLFAFSPYVLLEAAEGRPTQAIVGLLPLFVLELLRTGRGPLRSDRGRDWHAPQRSERDPGWRAPLKAGMLLAAIGYQYWYYALFAGLMAAAYAAWVACVGRRDSSSSPLAGEVPVGPPAPDVSDQAYRLRARSTAKRPEGGLDSRSDFLDRSGRLPGPPTRPRAADLPRKRGRYLGAATSYASFPLLARFALIGAVAFVLCAPVALPLAWKAQTDPAAVPGLIRTSAPGQTVTLEGRVQALQVWQPLEAGRRGEWTSTDQGSRFWPGPRPFPAGALLLIGVYLWRGGRFDRGAFLAMASITILISIGPVLVAGSTSIPNLPYQWLSIHFGVMQRLWWPARAMACLSVLLAMASAIALARLGWLGRRRQGVALLAMGLLWLSELRAAGVAPFPTWDATVPAGYRWLARAAPGALIELPFRWTQAHLYYQTSHGQPILGGMLEDTPAFSPPLAVALRRDNGFLRAMLAAATLEPLPDAIPDADREALYRLGFRYVVLQKDAYRADTREGLRQSIERTSLRRVTGALDRLLGAPVFDDDRTRIYAPWEPVRR